ncbi:MAG: hypothetical protein NVSMB62_10500 [Acidobacteriaceae bacterium]
MTLSPQNVTGQKPEPAVLHVCKRQILRPLRDQILRLSGFTVDSALEPAEALASFRSRPYDLVLVDVEGESGIPEAEALCGELKTEKPTQLVAFVCNWRVAVLSDCPDDVVRTEFNPDAFVKGVQDVLARH